MGRCLVLMCLEVQCQPLTIFAAIFFFFFFFFFLGL